MESDIDDKYQKYKRKYLQLRQNMDINYLTELIKKLVKNFFELDKITQKYLEKYDIYQEPTNKDIELATDILELGKNLNKVVKKWKIKNGKDQDMMNLIIFASLIWKFIVDGYNQQPFYFMKKKMDHNKKLMKSLLKNINKIPFDDDIFELDFTYTVEDMQGKLNIDSAFIKECINFIKTLKRGYKKRDKLLTNLPEEITLEDFRY